MLSSADPNALQPSTSIRRNPESSIIRMAARPVGCSPLMARVRMILPKCRSSSTLSRRWRPSDGELSNALRRVFADDFEPRGVPSSARRVPIVRLGNSGAAGRLAASPRFPPSRRLATGDISLHPFDVAEGEAADEPGAQQRLDMSLDPAPVHFQSRCLDQPDGCGRGFDQLLPRSNTSRTLHSLRGRHAAHVARQRDSSPLATPGQLLAGQVTRVFGRESSILAEYEPPGPAFDVPILDEKGPHADGFTRTPKLSARYPR